jgi:HEAT repeat protein
MILNSFGEMGSDECRMAMNLLEKSESLEANRAVTILGIFGKAAVPALIPALQSRKPSIRWAAAVVLERLGDSAAVRPLAQQMDDSVRFIAEEAARRITSFGKAEAEGPLTEHLRDKRPRMRIIAALNLAKIGSRRAVGPLMSALRDSSYRTRGDAAEALGQLGDTAAIRALVPLQTDPVWEVRNHSLWARGWLGDSTATEQLIAQCKELAGGHPGLALDALSHIGTRRATEALLEMLADQSGQYKVGKDAVVIKLALRHGPAVQAALAAQYESKFIGVNDSNLVRIGAPVVKHLITWKPALILKIGHEAADPVAAVMDTARDGVRIQCAKILVQLGDPRGRAALAAALRDTSIGDRAQWVRREAARAVVELGDSSFVSSLLDARRTPGWARPEVYKKLGELKYPGTASILLGDLAGNPDMRECIVGVLGELGDSIALVTLDSLAIDRGSRTTQPGCKSDAAHRSRLRSPSSHLASLRREPVEGRLHSRTPR